MVLTQFALMKTGLRSAARHRHAAHRARARRRQAHRRPGNRRRSARHLRCAQPSRNRSRFLLDAADDVPEMQQDLDRLIAAWRTGDLRALETEFQKERAQAPALYDELLGARNRKWMPKIEALLDDDRDYLVRGRHAALRRPGWPAGAAEARGLQAGGRARRLAGRQPLGHAQLRDLPRPDRAGARWHRVARLPGLAAAQRRWARQSKFSPRRQPRRAC